MSVTIIHYYQSYNFSPIYISYNYIITTVMEMPVLCGTDAPLFNPKEIELMTLLHFAVYNFDSNWSGI